MTKTATVDDDRYFDLNGLADYSGMSVRTLRRYLVDREHPLPHHYIRAAGKGRGRCLVYKREFDAWVRGFAVQAVEEPATLDDRVARAARRSRTLE